MTFAGKKVERIGVRARSVRIAKTGGKEKKFLLLLIGGTHDFVYRNGAEKQRRPLGGDRRF
jgi:hypothetical protein